MRTHLPQPTLLLATASLLMAAATAVAENYPPKAVEIFLSQHCYECHDDQTEEGDLNLLDLKFDPEDPGNFDTWQTVHNKVAHGDMPPKKQPRPEAEARKEFLTALGKPLIGVEREIRKLFGRVQTRRLTRREYEHTLHDLLGVDLPLQNLLPEDPASHGFETVADGQQLSHFNLAAYLDAADDALNAAFARIREGDKTFSKTYTPADLARKGGGNYRGPDLRDGRSISWPLRLQFFGRMPVTRVPESGWYRVTLKNVAAVNPINGVVWGTLRSGACSSSAPMMYPVGIVEATAKKRDLVFEAWIHEDHNLELKPNDASLKNPPTGASGGNVSFKGRDLEKQGFNGIAITGIEVERIYPNAELDQLKLNLLAGVDWSARKEGKSAREVIAPAIRHFARRAFRRPVTDEQVEPWIGLGVAEMQKPGTTALDGLHAAYRGILCSPRFLTFVEPVGKLDDHALAARLSYMVWNSLPDAQLRELADAGKLTSDPKVLHAQLDRLLNDSKSQRFIESFSDQWLNLKDIDFTTPDRRRFKSFDFIVQDAMLDETRHFLKNLITENASIKNLIQADHSFVNERLARFYGLEDVDLVPGKGVQKVTLPKAARGGLVTQASIMKVTANGTVTSPVVRGVFVNERILGRHISPPPPGVPAVEPDIRGAISIRDQLAKHSSDETCASCHAKFDPAGFALENLDPVGLWREVYGTSNKSAKVDPSGVTPEGKPFNALWEWKKIHAEQPARLSKAFAQHLLTYATGAPPQFSDEQDLQQVVDRAKEENYGVRSLLHAVVATEAFQSK
jgi:hypothetical protein